MPRDGATIFDLIGQARRAPDCDKCGRSIFHQVQAAQMPPIFQGELTNGNARMCQSTAGFTFAGE